LTVGGRRCLELLDYSVIHALITTFLYQLITTVILYQLNTTVILDLITNSCKS
jgi:hypothetical protein